MMREDGGEVLKMVPSTLEAPRASLQGRCLSRTQIRCRARLTLTGSAWVTRSPRSMVNRSPTKASREESTVFSTSGAGKTGPTYLKPYPKINAKWITCLSVRAKVIEFLNFCDLGLWKSALDVTAKAQATEEIGKLDFIKIRNFLFQVLCCPFPPSPI